LNPWLVRAEWEQLYLARHILLGYRVAIKNPAPEVRNTRNGCVAFSSEGQGCATAFVMQCRDCLRSTNGDDGTIYMVMEYVEGIPLMKLKKRGHFSAPKHF